MMKSVREEFEEKYGSFRIEYARWREQQEEKNREAKEKKSCFKSTYIHCGFTEARESFTEYCNLSEQIPYEVMLYYEQRYEEFQDGVK